MFSGHTKSHGSEMSVSGVTTIASYSVKHLLHIQLIVACGMSAHSSSMAVQVAGYWQELEHAVLQAHPEHPQQAQLVTCLVRTGMFVVKSEW